MEHMGGHGAWANPQSHEAGPGPLMQPPDNGARVWVSCTWRLVAGGSRGAGMEIR